MKLEKIITTMNKVIKTLVFVGSNVLGCMVYCALVMAPSVVLATNATNNYNSPSSPYDEDFDSGYAEGEFLNDKNGWSSPVDNTVFITNINAQGNLSMYVGTDYVVSNVFDGAKCTNLWIDFFTKPTLWMMTNPAVDARACSQFYFNSSSNVVAYDGNVGWVVLATNAVDFAATKIIPTNFTRVTIFQYYSNNTWALMINGVLMRSGMKMPNQLGRIGLNGFSISNSTYMDTITIGTNVPAITTDLDSDGMADTWELSYFRGINVQGWIDDYDSDGRTSSQEYTDNTDPLNPNSLRWYLPYMQTFETAPLAVITNWRAMFGSGNARVQNASYVQGSRAASISTGALSLVLSDATGTNVWVHVSSKPAITYNLSFVPATNVSAAFCVVSNTADLYAYSGSSWVKMGLIPRVPTNVWLGFAVHLDYTNRNWNLYVTTNNVYDPQLKLANATPLLMNAACFFSHFRGMSITSSVSAVTYVDMLAVSHAYTNPVLAVHSNVYAAERFANTTYTVKKPPYSYSGTNATMAGQLGIDLARGLFANDELSVLGTNGWNVYYINNSNWQARADATNIAINETTGLNMTRLPGSDFMMFYPYSSTNGIAATNTMVYGTDVPTLNGWNLLVWPGSSPVSVNDPSFGLTPISTDKIYIYKNYQYKKLYRVSGQWWCEGAPSTIYISPNQGFWFRNSASTGVYWNVGAIPQ